MNRRDRRAARKRGSNGRGGAAELPPSAMELLRVARAKLADGLFDDAAAKIEAALSLAPSSPALHQVLAEVRYAQGRLKDAVLSCNVALTFDPEFLPAHSTSAKILLAAGRYGEALSAVKRVLDHGATAEAKALFVASVSHVRFETATDELQDVLLQAVTEPWGRANELSRIVCPIIRLDPAVAGGLEALHDGKPIDFARISAAGRNRLFLAAMESIPLRDSALEALLTELRRLLLEAALAGHVPDRHGLAFAFALARQCFANEYVYAVSDAEEEQAARLTGRLRAGLADRSEIPAFPLAVIAAYQPLLSLPQAEQLPGRKWPAAADALITQQIREPLREQELARRIPRLTDITDAVSRAVESQYSENPYPRWIKTAPVNEPVSLSRYLRREFSGIGSEGLLPADTFDLLIAGCGTGQQVVETARLFPRARILAIDLSLPSLAYARRKLDEAGIANVELGQADILKIAGIGRVFDLILSGGVLHHLREPAAGWRQLSAVLRPGGFMRLALYSAIARREIVAAQSFVAGNGFPATIHGIRRSRAALRSAEDGDLRAVTEIADFFTVSELRDLLFHVSEHRLTLPEIEDLITANGLEFLGFDADPSVRSRYRARFPADAAMTDIAHWDAYERDNPQTFIGMYQFWLRKRR